MPVFYVLKIFPLSLALARVTSLPLTDGWILPAATAPALEKWPGDHQAAGEFSGVKVSQFNDIFVF